MADDLKTISDKLWSTAEKLRANSGILPAEYARPVLGLLFLRLSGSIGNRDIWRL
ncbi:type I restriction-modification system subunit M N-terminal domain-containing protein [Hoeflea sp. IMCC20628]|uniref:type I restriction-modification system subunit M N-terminal domain-containing protein n=1 Tax=Hoeflea sp. IMCC20628 TaxID=1620421 RepID=UPI000AAD18B6|nr:type I restriction-modification system subunit M N-terminal domain-containing protein [Hoeflea sp. IMCC20628]